MRKLWTISWLAALTVCLIATAVVAKERGQRPVLSCDTYSLRDYYGDGKLSHESVMALMKDLGIPGVALNEGWLQSNDKSYLDKLKAAAAASGVRITGVIVDGDLVGGDEAARKRQIEHDAERMRAAAYLGAPIVRLNLGGTGSAETDATVGIERAIDAFKQLLPLARELNVKMTIENHGGVSAKADWILSIIKGTDPKWVGACLDFGNWPEELRYSESEKLAPYAYHVHAKTHNFGPDGEDVNKDYGKLLGYLKAAKYRYAVSIEFEGPGDQIEGVKKTRDLILKHWPELRPK